MARFKEELTWVALNVEALTPSLIAKHAVIRGLFDQLKDAKAAFEAECDAALVKNAAKLPDQVKLDLRVNGGTFPVGTVRKFSYMRGVAVATATAPKSSSKSGITLG